jgi:hypothetical protein
MKQYFVKRKIWFGFGFCFTPKHIRGGWSHNTDTSDCSEPVDGNEAQNMVTVQSGFREPATFRSLAHELTNCSNRTHNTKFHQNTFVVVVEILMMDKIPSRITLRIVRLSWSRYLKKKKKKKNTQTRPRAPSSPPHPLLPHCACINTSAEDPRQSRFHYFFTF